MHDMVIIIIWHIILRWVYLEFRVEDILEDNIIRLSKITTKSVKSEEGQEYLQFFIEAHNFSRRDLVQLPSKE